MAEDREGPLARWSRLKRSHQSASGRGAAAPVSTAPERDPASAPEPGGGPPTAAPVEAQPTGNTGDDAQPVGDAALDLPPIDSLDKDSDYTPFLADGVPEKLARAALRKMWMSDPAFGIRDGLDDYDENFRYLRNVTDAMMAKTAKSKSAATPKKAAKKTKAKPKKTVTKKAKKATKAKKRHKAAAGKPAPGAQRES